MNQSIPTDLHARKLRERYRKAKRRQMARLLVFGIGGLLLLVGGFFAVRGLAGLKLKLPSLQRGEARAAKEDAATERSDGAVLAASRVLKPAPRFIVVSGETYYSAQGEEAEAADEGEGDAVRIARLGAYRLDDGEALWEKEVSLTSEALQIAGERLICHRQYLSEPVHLEISAFDALSGEPAWQHNIDGASQSMVEITPKAVVACYRLADGFRLVGHNPATGAKAWAVKPKLSGLLPAFKASDALWLQVMTQGNYLAYYYGNVAGIVDTSTGKLLREYSSTELINKIEIEETSKSCYILSSGTQPGAYVLQRLPFKGAPVNLQRFKSSGEMPGLVSLGNYLVLAYNEGLEDSAPVSRMFVFRPGESSFAVKEEFSDGYVWDVLADPGSKTRLLVLTRHDQSSDGSKGYTLIHALDLETGELSEARRINSPVAIGQRVDGDWLLLSTRGELLRYRIAENALKKLKRPRFDVTEIQYTPDESRLVLLSTPAVEEGSRPAQQQLLVYE